MKLTCRQPDLAQGLAAVSHAVAARSSLPILANILLATDNGRLRLAATNLEIGVNFWVEAAIEEEGTVTVPAKLFTDFVSTLTAEPLTLCVVEGTHDLTLQGERSSGRFRGTDAAEFPLIPGAEGSAGSVSFESSLLREVIEQVEFAAAEDETRPALTGVLVEVQPERITFAAADAFRLAVREVDLRVGDDLPSCNLLVPARSLKELGRILKELGRIIPPEASVELIATPNRNQVLFHTPQFDLVTRLIEAQFPNFRQIIPESHATLAVVATREIAGDVKRAALFAQDSENIMHLKVEAGEGGGALIVRAEAEDLGGSDNRLPASVEGGSIDIIFNVRYLADVLPVIGTPEVAVELTSPTKPGLIRPVGGVSYRYIIMPMHTSR